MTDDYYRRCAYDAVSEWLTAHSSNSLSNQMVWHAVNLALDRYEDELTQAAETRVAYTVMLGERPVITMNTKRQARQQRRFLKRWYPASGYRVVESKIAID